MKVEARRNGEVEFLDLNGKLTLGEPTAALRDAIRNLTSQGRKLIVLNLAEITYIDSAGIGELVSSFVAVEKQGGAVKLVNLEKRVHGILHMTKMLTVIEVFENEEAAVASFATLASLETAQ